MRSKFIQAKIHKVIFACTRENHVGTDLGFSRQFETGMTIDSHLICVPPFPSYPVQSRHIPVYSTCKPIGCFLFFVRINNKCKIRMRRNARLTAMNAKTAEAFSEPVAKDSKINADVLFVKRFETDT
jgi:hypothetical protein